MPRRERNGVLMSSSRCWGSEASNYTSGRKGLPTADEARRHGVIVIGDLNVVVGRGPTLLPLGKLIGRRRKGFERRSISANSSSRLTPSLRQP